jgi:hypothetical protein
MFLAGSDWVGLASLKYCVPGMSVGLAGQIILKMRG